ncbi:DUF3224 domain-containing protein [Mesorhizobium sp. B283B1A]|uniref:DUF3224 domain-containing protein n=1 Tax=Mesorhizobium TaxID=68287 RepID=UPI001CD10933|nr:MULTISPECIES: DUF3224 domain-containing protein [Mesorhizobium]MCA0046230.1 DUF3224 domain-containing protein [Mesorhizobium sp. B283B1A]UQS62848.1 DUF3224 domain-containing protein [Mesorhizobium opportunistum]
MLQAKTSDHKTIQSDVEVIKYDRNVIDQTSSSELAIVETLLEEKFSGGLEAVGTAKHVRLERRDGSGTLICYERIDGAVDDRRGSFLLEASGRMDANGYVHGRWEIIAHSGTGDLEGIQGYAAFMAKRDGRSRSGWSAQTTLTYWFE